MIEQQALHVIYVRLQDCCPLLIQCTLLGHLILPLILHISKMTLPRAKPDGSEGYDNGNSKLRNQIQPIPDRSSSPPWPIENAALLGIRRQLGRRWRRRPLFWHSFARDLAVPGHRFPGWLSLDSSGAFAYCGNNPVPARRLSGNVRHRNHAGEGRWSLARRDCRVLVRDTRNRVGAVLRSPCLLHDRMPQARPPASAPAMAAAADPAWVSGSSA